MTPCTSCPIGEAFCTPGRRVAGVDEAGRGPLAGPVVAAAVIIDPRKIEGRVCDSKRIPPRRREELYEFILSNAAGWSIGVAEVER